LTNLNIANIYEEHLNQVDSALLYSKKSLEIWKAEKDSMQIANLYKYIGLLNGKKGQFSAAKSAIQQAITMYQHQGFEQGIAVSEINLADTYFREKAYDKSIVHFNNSKAFWIQKDNKARVYTDNILGIKIFAAMKRATVVDRLIEENRKIAQEMEVNSFSKTKFEKLIKAIKKKPIVN